MLFQNSSHCKRWIFSQSSLNITYIRSNQRISDKIPDNEISKFPDSNDRLSVEEEKLLIKKYAKTIVVAFGAWMKQLSPQTLEAQYFVKWTAAILFKRYYLKNTIADMPPNEIMMGCMLLAAKLEEFHAVNLEAMVAWKPHFSATQIIEAELEVLRGINFDLVIFSPFTALLGLRELLQSKCQAEIKNSSASSNSTSSMDISPSNTLKLATQTLELMDKKGFREQNQNDIESLLYSDACFLYSPAEMALAAFCRSSPILSETCILLLETNIPEIDESFYTSTQTADNALVDKLSRVRNPRYDRTTPEYALLKQQEADAVIAKHELKAKQEQIHIAKSQAQLQVKPMDITHKS